MKAKILDHFSLLSLPTNDLVPYFDGLPSRGAKLTYLPREKVSKQFNCSYTEGLWVDSKVKSTLKWNKQQLKEDGVISGISGAELRQGIQKIRAGTADDFLAITKMDPSVGHGVFAIRDIPKHTVLCLYSGEIKAGRRIVTPHTNDYLFYTGNFHVEAYSRKGIASFMQHLPGSTKPFASHRESIAVTNVMLEFVEIDDIPIIVIVALRNISALEQV